MDKVDFSDALAQQNQQKALLNDALKQRQGFMYNLASALAQTPVQQGHGSWLSAFTNAFGRGYQGAVESAIQQQKSQDLSSALQSGNLSDAAKVAAAYGDTGLAQQLLGAQTTNEYRQAQLEESRLNREFNRAIKQQELAQKAAEDEAQRQYYLDKLDAEREQMAGTQAYRESQIGAQQQQLDLQQQRLDLERAQMEQKAAEEAAQREYLVNKFGTETYLTLQDQALKQAQLEQTGAYNTAKLAQEQAKLDQEIAQQKATADYYAGKNVDYSKLPVSALKEIAEKQEKEAEKEKSNTFVNATINNAIDTINQNEDALSLYGKSGLGRLSSENRQIQATINQQATVVATALTSLAREGGAAAQMMNSDKEGQRALGILADPVNATGSELKAAFKVAQEYLNYSRTGVLPERLKGFVNKTETAGTTTGSTGYDYSKYGF